MIATRQTKKTIWPSPAANACRTAEPDQCGEHGRGGENGRPLGHVLLPS